MSGLGLVHEHGRLEPYSVLSPEPMEADECVGVCSIVGVKWRKPVPTYAVIV